MNNIYKFEQLKNVWDVDRAEVEMLYSPVSSSPAKYVIKARMHNLGVNKFLGCDFYLNDANLTPVGKHFSGKIQFDHLEVSYMDVLEQYRTLNIAYDKLIIMRVDIPDSSE